MKVYFYKNKNEAVADNKRIFSNQLIEKAKKYGGYLYNYKLDKKVNIYNKDISYLTGNNFKIYGKKQGVLNKEGGATNFCKVAKYKDGYIIPKPKKELREGCKPNKEINIY